MAGSNLQKAKEAKFDEFYTGLEEIRDEMNTYTEHFNGKVVYCNCDDPFESNFVKYFLMNFNRLGLKKLQKRNFTRENFLGKRVATR